MRNFVLAFSLTLPWIKSRIRGVSKTTLSITKSLWYYQVVFWVFSSIFLGTSVTICKGAFPQVPYLALIPLPLGINYSYLIDRKCLHDIYKISTLVCNVLRTSKRIFIQGIVAVYNWIRKAQLIASRV